jgi:hypothetical protein
MKKTESKKSRDTVPLTLWKIPEVNRLNRKVLDFTEVPTSKALNNSMC